MYLNNAQVCLDCENLFVGDECPKCTGRRFFYLRKYFPPMIRFGGNYVPVTLRISPIQEEIPFVQGYSTIGAYSVNSDTLDRELAMVHAQEEYVKGANYRNSEEEWLESKFGSLDYRGGKLLEAICILLKGCPWTNASPPSYMEEKVDKRTTKESRGELEGRDVDTQEVYEGERDTKPSPT